MHIHSDTYMNGMYALIIDYRCLIMHNVCTYTCNGYMYSMKRGRKKLTQHGFGQIMLPALHFFLISNDCVLSTLSFPFNQWSI